MAMGGPAGSPRKPVKPDHACNVNSLAARSAYGPVQPKSEIVTMTARGESRQQLLRIDAQRRRPRPAGGDDDDVGSGQFGAIALGVCGDGQAALAGLR